MDGNFPVSLKVPEVFFFLAVSESGPVSRSGGRRTTMHYGRYETVRELGKGSMGVVYQAHDPQIDRTVALKVLRQDRHTSEAFVRRFIKEAKAIGRLSHPNIVRSRCRRRSGHISLPWNTSRDAPSTN